MQTEKEVKGLQTHRAPVPSGATVLQELLAEATQQSFLEKTASPLSAEHPPEGINCGQRGNGKGFLKHRAGTLAKTKHAETQGEHTLKSVPLSTSLLGSRSNTGVKMSGLARHGGPNGKSENHHQH